MYVALSECAAGIFLSKFNFNMQIVGYKNGEKTYIISSQQWRHLAQ